ncbi:MAG: glucose-1-phosphate thymidylyltransferase [Methanobacteriota archaeon]|nr:MAG: glucose-1-phosphate thymidylyltransferase [Euryarchaeota archaeon]
MKAWILSAGEGTRMRPLTANLPKPLLPVAGKPFLAHTIEALRGAGIGEIAVLIGWQGRRVKEYFGRGDAFGVKLSYDEQVERLGTAHAIGMAREHVDGDFLSVNGDVVVSTRAVKGLLEFHRKTKGPVMAVAEVEDPAAFGVVELDGDRVVGLEEKPKAPKSKLINAGVYLFPKEIFGLIDRTPKSARGEFEITDTIRLLMADQDVFAYRIPDPWIDVGRPWDLLAANAILMAGLKGRVDGDVAKGATLVGEVVVEAGSKILDGAYLQGPTIIGRESEIGPNCFVRPATTVGRRCKVGNACEVKNSILMDGTHVPHQNYVGDSILGERCNLGAGTKVANLRLDEESVRVPWRGHLIDTGLRKLGVIMGDDVKTGINASIDVGTVIGEETFIGPGAIARGVIAARSRIY